MAKAKQHRVYGTFEWAKVFEENRDMEGWNDTYKDCDGAYTIDVIMDKDNMELFKASGSAKKIHDNDDGTWKVKLVRKHVGPFKAAGGPPKVKWDDGDKYDYEAEGTLGNGTKGYIDYEVYPTKAGIKGTRLLSVFIMEKVTYEPEDDDDEVPV